MADKIQFLRRIDGAAGTPGTDGYLPGEIFLNFPDGAGVGTEVVFSAFDGTWWRTVSVSVTYANDAEVLEGVVSTKTVSPAGLNSRIIYTPSVDPADDEAYLAGLDATGKIPAWFLPGDFLTEDSLTGVYVDAAEDVTNGPLVAAATFDGGLAFLDEAYRKAWISVWLDGEILPNNNLLARSDEGEIIGVPMTPIAAMTFGAFAAGSINVYSDARSLALLEFPTAVTIADGIAQITWDGSSSSLYRTVSLTALADTADIRFDALTEAEAYLAGKDFKIEVVNTNGGAKIFTLADDSEAGDATVLTEDAFTLPSIGTAAGDRVVLRGSIASDNLVLVRSVEVYGAAAPSSLTPLYVGSNSIYENYTSTMPDIPLPLPPEAQVGDMAIITVPQAAASLTALGYGTSLELITRLNATVGSNYGVSCYKYTLVAGDITLGSLNIPSHTNRTAVGVDIFRNVDTVTHAEGFTRSTGLNANSIVLESEESDFDAAIALAIVARGGGLRVSTFPAGWTSRINRMDAAVAGAGRFSLHTMTKTLGVAGSVSPADAFAITGAADQCFTTFTLLLEKS